MLTSIGLLRSNAVNAKTTCWSSAWKLRDGGVDSSKSSSGRRALRDTPSTSWRSAGLVSPRATSTQKNRSCARNEAICSRSRPRTISPIPARLRSRQDGTYAVSREPAGRDTEQRRGRIRRPLPHPAQPRARAGDGGAGPAPGREARLRAPDRRWLLLRLRAAGAAERQGLRGAGEPDAAHPQAQHQVRARGAATGGGLQAARRDW